MSISNILIAVLAFTGTLAAAETAIVNPASSLANVNADQFKDIYLGKQQHWSDGSKIVVVLAESGPSNDALMKLLGKNQSQFTTGWKKLVFTGKGAMPEFVKDDAAVIAVVAKTPGAIGYVSAAADGVKAIAVQ